MRTSPYAPGFSELIAQGPLFCHGSSSLSLPLIPQGRCVHPTRTRVYEEESVEGVSLPFVPR